MASERVLLVDDEELVLSSYQRVLRKQIQVEVACGGQQAIEKIAVDGPFAVVVSDMRMPGMNGIELLRHLKTSSPETVRLMLTGNSDVQTAIDAVNEGSVFRFLTKPCPPENLLAAISAGLDQYRLVRAEKDLLEQTLNGSVRMLTEVMSLINPSAFNEAFRIAKYVRSIVKHLNLANAWQYDVAALLSNLGEVVLPKGSSLHTDRVHVVQRLISNIPRMEPIAEMIGKMGAAVPVSNQNDLPEDSVRTGAEILRTCSAFDRLICDDMTAQAAIKELRESAAPRYLPRILDALAAVSRELFEFEPVCVRTDSLNDHMVFNEDLRGVNGTLLCAKGTPITQTLLLRLQNFRNRKMLPMNINVLMPPAYASSLASEQKA